MYSELTHIAYLSLCRSIDEPGLAASFYVLFTLRQLIINASLQSDNQFTC